jgi:hypothetical protein
MSISEMNGHCIRNIAISLNWTVFNKDVIYFPIMR